MRKMGIIGREDAGFTLIELLCVVAIAALLGALSIPGMRENIRSNDASAAAAHLHRALQHARTEAQRQQRKFTVCGSENGADCSKKWSHYLLLFEDINGNKAAEPEEIRHQYAIDTRGTEIQTRLGFGKILFNFNYLGRANLTGSFLICSASTGNTPLRKITWNRIGRPYVLKNSTKVAAHSKLKCV